MAILDKDLWDYCKCGRLKPMKQEYCTINKCTEPTLFVESNNNNGENITEI